jgi:hypothetical protein
MKDKQIIQPRPSKSPQEIRVNVESHPDLGTTGHVESVNRLYTPPSSPVILFHVGLKTKYKSVSAYGGASDEDCQSIWVGMDEIQIFGLPDYLQENVKISEVSKYEIFICIFTRRLLEEMCCPNPANKTTLWEKPDPTDLINPCKEIDLGTEANRALRGFPSKNPCLEVSLGPKHVGECTPFIPAEFIFNNRD